MNIIEASFKKLNNELYLFIYYDNGKICRYKIKENNYRDRLFLLLTDITILHQFREV